MAKQLVDYEFKKLPVKKAYLRAESVTFTRNEIFIPILDENKNPVFDEKTGRQKTEKKVQFSLNGTNNIFTDFESSKDGTQPLEQDFINLPEVDPLITDQLLELYYGLISKKYPNSIDV